MELITAALMLAKLGAGVAKAIEAGRTTVTEEDLDIAVDDLQAGDADLSAAIQRAAAREAAGGQ